MIITTAYSDELTEDIPRVVIEKVQQVFSSEIQGSLQSQSSTSTNPLSRTPERPRSIEEVPGMVKQLLESFSDRINKNENDRTFFTEEEVNLDMFEDSEDTRVPASTVLTFSLDRREPGSFGQGRPFESSVKNFRPVLRQVDDDLDNPGYRKITFGYWHDNILCFTCWARTNKKANQFALEVERILRDYDWWVRLQGVSRFLFWRRRKDEMIEISDKRIYGRPLEFFVRTEELSYVSSKKMEELIVKINASRV